MIRSAALLVVLVALILRAAVAPPELVEGVIHSADLASLRLSEDVVGAVAHLFRVLGFFSASIHARTSAVAVMLHPAASARRRRA